VVGPLQYIWWESLDVLVDNGMHLDVYIVGDDGTAKRELRVMCRGMPFRCRDAGRLCQARFIEHMTLFTGAFGPLYRDGVRMRGDVTGEEEMRVPVDIDSETQVFFMTVEIRRTSCHTIRI
jgi:hypothetical protein